jgi:hypothetical protein
MGYASQMQRVAICFFHEQQLAAIAPAVAGKVMSVFIRATKPALVSS